MECNSKNSEQKLSAYENNTVGVERTLYSPAIAAAISIMAPKTAKSMIHHATLVVSPFLSSNCGPTNTLTCRKLH